jgi:hypothetical protein
MFLQPINTPYHTNTHKEIFNKGKDYENPNVTAPTNHPQMNTSKLPPNEHPILDLKLYPEKKGRPPLADKQAALPIEPIALTTPFFPPQFQNQLSNFMKNFYTPFIYKDYHINIGGPNADHIKASMVYEDALPPANIYTSYKSLKERNNLCKYIRGTFIQIEEGENIDFEGGPDSLNSRIKLIELNPYNTNNFSNNPYKGLPKDLLIYSSCYPIQYDKAGATVQCQKNCTGLNLRIYRLKIEEAILIKEEIKRNLLFDVTQNDPKKNETIRDFINILKKDELSKEAKLEEIIKIVKNELDDNIEDKILNQSITIKNAIENLQGEAEQEAQNIFNFFDTKLNTKLGKVVSKKNFNVWREVEYYRYIRDYINRDLTTPNFVQSYCYFVDNKSQLSFLKNGFNDFEENFKDIYSNKTIILLTESPSSNIFTWCSDVYQSENNIKKQVYRGFKDDNEWSSVIAQILISFYVMDKYNFTFSDMKLNSNFYIKDISATRESVQYWKYTVNFIDYYVPNYGSLVLVDSDYRDLDTKFKYKIISEFFEDDKDDIKNMIRANAKECLSLNNFGQEFKNKGGVRPSEDIMMLLTNITKDLDNNETFEKIIQNNFLKYVHNRIGTSIRDPEFRYIIKSDIRPFRKGNLVIYESRYQNYEILLYLNNNEESECQCVTKEKGNIIIKNFPKDLLYHYSDAEIIRQDIKVGEPSLNLDYIIENYVI